MFKNVKTGLDKVMKFVNFIFSTIELADNINNIYTSYEKIMYCCDGNCNDPLKYEAISDLGRASGAAVTKWLADLWMMPTLFTQISAGIPTLGTTILTAAVQLAAQYTVDSALKADIKYNIDWSDYRIEICRIKCSGCQCKLGAVCNCPPPCMCAEPPLEPASWWNYFWRELLPLPDPSGYVYEAVHSNRLEGVTATAYYQQEVWGEDIDGNPTLIRTDTILWDAENYSQENPLVTDSNGQYAWDVMPGLWQVKYEKEGYQTIYSEWLPVPPPQTEVNVGMVSLDVPTAKVVAYPEGVEITFDKYMKTATVASAVTIKQNGILIASTVEPKNEENGLATIFRFTPSTELALTSVNVSIENTAESYAGIKILAFSQNTDVILEPKMLTAHNITIPYASNGGDIIIGATLNIAKKLA